MVNYYHTGIYVLVVDLKMSTYIAIKLKNFNFIFFLLQVTALCVIPMTWQYWVMVVGLIVICGSIFNLLSFLGQRMLAQFEEKEKQLLALETLQGCDNSLNVAE
jgi:Flp pilus assembly protein TadB